MPSKPPAPSYPPEDISPPQPTITDDMHTEPHDNFEYATAHPGIPDSTYEDGELDHSSSEQYGGQTCF